MSVCVHRVLYGVVVSVCVVVIVLSLCAFFFMCLVVYCVCDIVWYAYVVF